MTAANQCITDYLRSTSRLKIRFKVPKIRDVQNQAIDFAAAYDRANIQMPTGSGKSLVIRGLSYYHVDESYTAIIIVPGYEIGDTILGEIAYESSRLNPKFHAPQRSLKVDSSSRIVLTTYQTFWRRCEEYRKIFKGKIVVFYDEAHHVNVLAPRNFQAACSFDKVYSISASPWSPFCLAITKNRFVYHINKAISDGVIATPQISQYIPPTEDISLQPEIWYYPGIDDALHSFGKAYRETARGYVITEIGENQHAKARAGFTCSKEALSTPNLVREFNRGNINRAVVVNKLREGFDSNLVLKGQKVPVKRVVILSTEISPISLYQKAGRALRPGGGKIHCYPQQYDVLRYAFNLADGEEIICDTCGEEHLTCHHQAVQTANQKLIEDAEEQAE